MSKENNIGADFKAPKKELNLDALKQVGTEGGAVDYVRPSNNLPINRKWGVNNVFTSREISKPFAEFTSEDFDSILPQSIRDEGYRINEDTLKVRNQEKYVSRLDEVVSMTTLTYTLLPPHFSGDTTLAEALVETAKAPKKLTKAELNTKQERSLIVTLGDWQLGQADGDGAVGIVKRVAKIADLVKKEISNQKKLGTPITQIDVFSLGDLVEGTACFYSNQTFTVTLNRREQVKTAAGLFQSFIQNINETGLPIKVYVVPGNHGQHRTPVSGKILTNENDNDDVACVEFVAKFFYEFDNTARANNMQELFGNIEFFFPEGNRISLTTEVLGHTVAAIHGDQLGGGKNLGKAVNNYINKQYNSEEPIGNADYLLFGHFHHFYSERITKRTTAVMNGAMCQQSEIFTERFGMAGEPTVVLGVITRDGDEGFRPFTIK